MTMHDVLARIRAEYLEMPGMQLTAAQAQRLFGVEHTTCALALHALVHEHFLRVTANSCYARLTDGEVPRPRPVRADLRIERRAAAQS